MRTKQLLCVIIFCVSFQPTKRMRKATKMHVLITNLQKLHATLAAQEDELQAAIEERLTDSGSNIFSLSISDSSINVIFFLQ